VAIVNLTATERTMLTFNASGSSDNSNSISSYHWDLGDGTADDGKYVNHSYSIAGSYKVKLTVTDVNGNAANITKTVTINYGPRPDLRALSITIDPSNYGAGDKVSIRLNIVNVGNESATGAYVIFSLVDLSGNRQEIGNSSQLFVNGVAVDRIGPGETGYIVLNYTFPSQGSFNLEATAYSVDEVKSVDNTVNQGIKIGESGTTLLILVIVVALIAVVAVVVVVYLRKRPRTKRKK
jgi:PKD repeat protein